MHTAAVKLRDAPAPMVRPIIGKAPLDPLVADKLLDLLSTDNAFRRLFRKDPLAALIEAGYQFPVSKQINTVQLLPWLKCFATGKLANKREITASRDLIRSFVTGSGTHQVVFAFESGKITIALSREK